MIHLPGGRESGQGWMMGELIGILSVEGGREAVNVSAASATTSAWKAMMKTERLGVSALSLL